MLNLIDPLFLGDPNFLRRQGVAKGPLKLIDRWVALIARPAAPASSCQEHQKDAKKRDLIRKQERDEF
jgi:hypothetical protein